MSEDGGIKRPREWQFTGTGIPPASAHGYLLQEVTSLDGARVARLHRTGVYVGEEILEVDGAIVDRGGWLSRLTFSDDGSRFIYARGKDVFEAGRVIAKDVDGFALSPDGAQLVTFVYNGRPEEGTKTFVNGVLVHETSREDQPDWQPPWKRGPYR